MPASFKYRIKGASLLSYGLLVGLISVVALVAVTSTGSSVDNLMSQTGVAMQGVTENSEAGPAEATPTPPELFAFTSHTFTTCANVSQRTGPTLASCQSEYSGESWSSDPSQFSEGDFQGYQLWTVPADGNYRITAAGASSGEDESHIGHGYELSGVFALSSGDRLNIVVGQTGNNTSSVASGGGGTFVALGASAATAVPLIIAGGGGGHRTNGFCSEMSATGPSFPLGNGTCFTNSNYGSCDNGASIAGQGGELCSNPSAGCPGGTGAGFEGDGLDGPCLTNDAPLSFRNGAVGGANGGSTTWGGFGGGSSSGNGGCGAGGGYSGGGAHDHNCGGGSSYIDSNATGVTEAGVRSGSSPLVGFVTIEKL